MEIYNQLKYFFAITGRILFLLLCLTISVTKKRFMNTSLANGNNALVYVEVEALKK